MTVIHASHCSDWLFEAAWLDNAPFAGERPPLAVMDPWDESTVGTVPACTPDDVRAAIAAAGRAQPGWGAAGVSDRAAVLAAIAALLRRHRPALAELLTREQGKPLAEAAAEIDYSASYFEFFAAEAPLALEPESIPGPPGRILGARHEPVGVCAAITPWNFPSAMLARKLAAALAAGCSMVALPSPLTPFSALALARITAMAGLPAGVFAVLTGDPVVLAPVLTGSPVVRKLSFTGSVPVGHLLYRDCAASLKRLTLELGGNAPFLIFADADLPAAVEALIACKFRNAGQTCICANRILVEETVLHEVTAMLASRIATLSCGHGLQPGTQLGPLISNHHAARVRGLAAAAIQAGAAAHAGQAPAHPRLVAPVLLTGVTPAMAVWQQEIFGPIAPVTAFRSEAEAIALANDTTAGLAAYVFSADGGRCQRLTAALRVGMVGVNSAAISLAQAPFGGIGDSGFGREGSRHGIYEYTALKYTCTGTI